MSLTNIMLLQLPHIKDKMNAQTNKLKCRKTTVKTRNLLLESLKDIKLKTIRFSLDRKHF